MPKKKKKSNGVRAAFIALSVWCAALTVFCGFLFFKIVDLAKAVLLITDALGALIEFISFISSGPANLPI